ncbi:MAG: hypothetical protein ACTHJG_06920 [Rhodanobacteraceae bacterium]
MAARPFKELSVKDQQLRNKLLVSENQKLHVLVAKLELENISLKSKNDALKKRVEERASEIFVTMLGKIAQRGTRTRGARARANLEPRHEPKRKQRID